MKEDGFSRLEEETERKGKKKGGKVRKEGRKEGNILKEGVRRTEEGEDGTECIRQSLRKQSLPTWVLE